MHRDLLWKGIGQVAPTMAAVVSAKLKYSIGGGVRFQLDQQERINFKFDVGSTREGTDIYFGVGEAF